MGGPQYDRNFGGYRVFCGDLGSRTNKFELEKEFDAFGPLVDCWVARNPPGFAFIVYKHADDAERAVEELDGRTICGRRVRVEHARPTGSKKGASFGRGYLRQRSPGYRSPDARRDHDDDKRPSRRERKRSPSRSRSRSSSREERRSSRRHHRRSRSRSKKESKRKHRSTSSRSPATEKKRSRQRSSSRDRSSSPVEKGRRDRSSRSQSKEDNDEKKEGNKNDNDKSVNDKNDHDENDESRSSPTPGEAEMKNNDED